MNRSFYHRVEAAHLRLKAAELDVIIADKNVDLAHYRGCVKYYRDRATHKQGYSAELLGQGFYKNSMEAEISYHANQ